MAFARGSRRKGRDSFWRVEKASESAGSVLTRGARMERTAPGHRLGVAAPAPVRRLCRCPLTPRMSGHLGTAWPRPKPNSPPRVHPERPRRAPPAARRGSAMHTQGAPLGQGRRSPSFISLTCFVLYSIDPKDLQYLRLLRPRRLSARPLRDCNAFLDVYPLSGTLRDYGSPGRAPAAYDRAPSLVLAAS
jgi:hypothetical protein